ncbi:chemotaxis protein CheW [Evansella cellulosilytica]|uniref:Chemotaxis protein CheW n=1 Tax=Evansella cellulosilytica (strain ATCC 21833 / DSM 2522 / FERM P-1141 / JCM 9156 / N-4) TaxID=649639 RepID=E6TSU3_EVAC2|nr:chemotaxis protein CheW [Evansella cellulosilytica]ADU30735.1 CheW protein [Evansella cellulosilytica DSM 2522]
MNDQTMIQDSKIIVFQLKNEEYGVGVEQVRSIERVQQITRVPKAPEFVKGVINLRGIVTPIIDLRSRFDMDEIDHTDNTRIIIVSVDEMDVGLIVDAANDVIDIPESEIVPPPEVIGGVQADYIRGVAKLEKRLLIILNLDKVLSTEEISEMRNIEAKA